MKAKAGVQTSLWRKIKSSLNVKEIEKMALLKEESVRKQLYPQVDAN